MAPSLERQTSRRATMASAAALPTAPTTNVTFAVNYELPMVDQFMKVERKRRSSTNPTGATTSNNIGSSNHGEENESSESEQQQQVQVQLQQQPQLPVGQRSPPGRRVSSRDKQKRSAPVTRTRVRYDLSGVPPVRRNQAFLDCFETWWKKPPAARAAPTATRRSTRLANAEEEEEQQPQQQQPPPPPEFCQCSPGFPFLDDSSVLWTPSNRSEWEDTVSEMTAVCTQAALRRRTPADQNRPFVPPLSRDYIRDRIDIDDPLRGYQLRHKQGGWLQGFVLYTNFTTWTHGFHWDSRHPMSGFPADGRQPPQPHTDADGALAAELEAEPRAGDPRGGGIVFSSLAEIGLLGGLGCGEYLLRMALQDIWSNPRYKYVVLQATDQSKAFYERFGFVRVGAICQYGKSEKAKAAEKKAKGKGKSTKGSAKGKGKGGTAAASKGERPLSSSVAVAVDESKLSQSMQIDSANASAVESQSGQPPLSKNGAKLPPISEATGQRPSALEESERRSQSVDSGKRSSEVEMDSRPTANGSEAITDRPPNDSKPAADETKSVTFEREPAEEAQSADEPEPPTGAQHDPPVEMETQKQPGDVDKSEDQRPDESEQLRAASSDAARPTEHAETVNDATADKSKERSSSDEQNKQPSNSPNGPQQPADSEMREKQTADAPNEPSSSDQPDLQSSEPASGAHGDVEMQERPTAHEPGAFAPKISGDRPPVASTDMLVDYPQQQQLKKGPGRRTKPNVPEIDVTNMPIVGYRHWTHANESEKSLQKHGGPSYMMCLKLPERTANGSIEELEACFRCGGRRLKSDEVSFTDQMLAMLQVDRKPRIEQLGATSTPGGGLKLARRSLSMPIEFNSSSRSLGINSGNASPRFGRKLIRRGSDIRTTNPPSVAPSATAAKAKNSSSALSTTSSINKNKAVRVAQMHKRSHSMAESEGPARKRQKVEIAVSSAKSASKKAAPKAESAKSAAKKSASKSRERTRTPKSATEVRPPPPKNGKPLSYAQKQYHSVWLAVPPDVPAAAAAPSPQRAHPLERAALAAVTATKQETKLPPRERRAVSSATTTISAASKRKARRPAAKIGRPTKKSSTAKSSRSSTSKTTKTTSRKSSRKSSNTTTKLDDGREFYSVRGPDGKFIRVEKGRGRSTSKTPAPRRSNSRSRSETVPSSSKRRVSEARKSNTSSSSKKKKKSLPARSPPAKNSRSLFVLLKAGKTRDIDPKTFRKQKVQAFPKEKIHFYNKIVRRKRGSADKYFYVLEYDEENKLLCLVPMLAKGTLTGQREGRPRYRCDIGDTDANFKIVSASDYAVVRSCAIMKTSLVSLEAWDIETDEDENFITRSS